MTPGMLAQSVLSLGLGFVAVPGGWACGTRPRGAGEPTEGGHPARGFLVGQTSPLETGGPVQAHVCVGRWGQEGGLGGRAGIHLKEAPRSSV